MAADQISFTIAKKTVQEQSTTVINAKFLNRTTQATVTPTNVKYRLDDLSNGAVILDWTSVTPATNVNITITATQNSILNDYNSIEPKQIVVAADYGLSTQFIDRLIWNVKNIQGLN